MRCRAAAIVVAAALALGALPACGSAQQPAPGGAKAAVRPGGIGLKKIGEFEKPVYVAGAPGFPGLLFVVEQPGRVEVLHMGHELGRPFLDLRSLVGYDGASAACSRSPSRPTTRRAGASTSTTPTSGATSGSTNSSGAAQPVRRGGRAGR